MAEEIFDKNQQYLVNLDGYSRVVVTVLTDTFIAHAIPGTATTDTNWRCQKIDDDGSRQWADSGDFSQAATGISGLSYSY